MDNLFLERRNRGWAKTLKFQATVLGGLVLSFWLVEVVDMLLQGVVLDQWGIRPRQVDGLWGVVFAPFLHAGFGHVATNTLPFLVLGWFVLLQGIRPFLSSPVTVMLISGLGTWLIAPANTVHIGASGLIFGYFGFLLLRGYFARKASALLCVISGYGCCMVAYLGHPAARAGHLLARAFVWLCWGRSGGLLAAERGG
jgi:membrane associated rhomboid family serine protease